MLEINEEKSDSSWGRLTTDRPVGELWTTTAEDVKQRQSKLEIKLIPGLNDKQKNRTEAEPDWNYIRQI